jgi:hypothetical protein
VRGATHTAERRYWDRVAPRTTDTSNIVGELSPPSGLHHGKPLAGILQGDGQASAACRPPIDVPVRTAGEPDRGMRQARKNHGVPKRRFVIPAASGRWRHHPRGDEKAWLPYLLPSPFPDLRAGAACDCRMDGRHHDRAAPHPGCSLGWFALGIPLLCRCWPCRRWRR